MRVFVKILLQIYCFLMFEKLVQTDKMSLEGANCFENYLQELSSFNNKYLESLKKCEEQKFLAAKILDPEAERKNLELISKETCFDLTACSKNKKSIEFFDCHVKIATINMNRFVDMHLHASSLAIELNSDYTEKEKEIFRCYLSAKRNLIENFFSAYTHHLQCLNGS